MDDIIPEAKGSYEYYDSTKVEEKYKDQLFFEIDQLFQESVEELDQENIKLVDQWKYIPDRLASDTSLSRSFMIDSSLVIYKRWKYGDSITNINALYNWLDCFGDKCKSISIGDSIGVSKNGFLLFQDNRNIHFVQSPKRLEKKVWEKFFTKDQKNASWNYVIKQTPRGKITWEIRQP